MINEKEELIFWNKKYFLNTICLILKIKIFLFI